jgi:hypothetical protein
MAAPDEEALKQFIARLPDPGKEHEIYTLDGEELSYLDGVADAYRVLTGETPKSTGTLRALLERAELMRGQHEPEWVDTKFSGRYCKVCDRPAQESGDVPWHSTPA